MFILFALVAVFALVADPEEVMYTFESTEPSALRN